MNILGLPGRIPETATWLTKLFDSLSLCKSDISSYRHWKEDIEPDIYYEAEKFRNISVDLVVAKSLGTLIATKAYESYSFKTKRAIFIGNPLRRLIPEYVELLDHFANTVPILFIQQTSDPKGSYRQLESITQRYELCNTVEVSGNDHLYNNFNELKSIIKSWMRILLKINVNY
jgi:hypothetical protein